MVDNEKSIDRLLVGVDVRADDFSQRLLLFEVQPILSKFILPWFGGSPMVWTTCMVFFQTVLFGGYLYAHLIQQWFGPRWQAAVHLALLTAAVLLLPIAPDAAWKPLEAGSPTWRIIALLAVSVGLPYFMLSTTGPLVQAWFSRTFPGRSPYRLYALSNIGSLLALLSYPFYVESTWPVGHQTSYWSWGFIAFAALCGITAVDGVFLETDCALWSWQRPKTSRRKLHRRRPQVENWRG